MTGIKERSVKHLKHQGAGNFINYTPIPHGLTITGEKAHLRILVYTPDIIRVQITTRYAFEDLSYAVVTQPLKVDFEVDDQMEHLSVVTANLELRIDKSPLRCSFLDSEGRVINEDDPGFGISFMGNDKTIYKTLQEEERFIGLGEKTGNLDRQGEGYTNWNTDSFAYGPNSDPIYCTFPFYIGLHENLAYGIFLDNSYKSHFNFGASNHRFSSFTVEGGDLDYYFIHHRSVREILSSYTHLTGRMEMPPLWGLGYQQCRYSYYPQEEVYSVARTFREKKIPADVVVLDIHYMDAYKIFSWDKSRFPDPEKMLQDLKEQGFQVVVMCDPGIKIEEGYAPYEDGLGKDIFLKYPDGSYYHGEVWPGWCHFPDFTNPKARSWWGEKFRDYVRMGVRGFWNDMNEIATWGQRLPDLIEFDFEGQGGSAKRGRNVFGLMMSRSTYEGTKKLLQGERPFNLTRSAYSGVQRYSAVWTGDNVATDEHMLLGVRLVNSLGLSGVAFTGYDVGGFVGDTSVGLFARWISLGAFSPFFRGHTMINSRDSEPWTFGEEVEDISRNYINLRYRLLPYLYSVFYEATQNGMPVSRSLAIDYTFDDHIYQLQYQNQYLFGPCFLVAPVESYKELLKVYLPQGSWYDFHNDKLHEGAREIFVECPLPRLPLFVKAGSIIPMQTQVQTTAQNPEPVLHLHVYDGPESEFTYYEDDGLTFQYQKDAYYLRQMHFSDSQLTLSKVEGAYEGKFEQIKLYLHGFSKAREVEVNGKKERLVSEEVVFLPEISNFDPIQPKDMPQDKVEKGIPVQTVQIANASDAFTIIIK